MTEVKTKNLENQTEMLLEAAKLKAALQERPIRVLFEKADGNLREMFCTTNIELVPWPDNPTEGSSDILKEKDPNLFVVWDLEKEAWRSFRFERLKEWTNGDI